MDHIKEQIAYFCDARERRILGYDLDECIRLKFPPSRLCTDFKRPEWRCERDPYNLHRVFISFKMKGLHIQRMGSPDDFEDSYSINNIRYTHSYDYLTHRYVIWHGTTSRDCEEGTNF